jgi:hypothetical protein
MFKKLLLFTVFTIGLLSNVTASPLVVTKSTLQLKNFNVGQQNINLALFQIEFDQPIFLDAVNSQELVSLTSLTGTVQMGENQGDTMPQITVLSGGVMRFQCGNVDAAESYPIPQQQNNNNNNNGGGGGAPDFLMMISPTSEPAASFLTMMNGGFLNETWTDNKIAAGLLLNMGGNHMFSNFNDLIACQPRIIFPGTVDSEMNPAPGNKLTNAQGQAFTGSVLFNRFDKGVCNRAGLTEFLRNYNSYSNSLQSITSQNDLSSIEFEQAALEVRDVWGNCRQEMNAFFMYEDAEYLMDNVYGCFAFQDTPEARAQFAADPCCNQTLGATQCCVPKDNVAMRYSKPVGFNERLLSQCAHPEAIQYVLKNFAEADQAITQVEIASHSNGADGKGSQNDIWTKYTAFMETCQNLLFNKACKLDTDCVYSKRCNLNNNNGMCEMDWSNHDLFLLKCYLDEMPTDLMFELSSMWEVPYSNNPTTQLENFWVEMQARVMSEDCVGPRSDLYRSKRIWSQQNNGQSTLIPGNQTGCLSEYACNWNSWDNTTPQKCVGAEVLIQQGTHMCGLYDGNQYRDFTMQPRCTYQNAQTSQQCQQAGGRWTTQSQNNWEFSYCWDNRTSSREMDNCISGPMCASARQMANSDPRMGYVSDWFCSADSCYTQALNQQQCDQLRQDNMEGQYSSFVQNLWYNQEMNTCVRFSDWNQGLDATTCHHFNFTVHHGKAYMKGQWYNEQECDRGVCSVQHMQQHPVTPEACAASPACNQPCARCQSWMRDMNGLEQTLCYTEDYTDSFACQVAGGNWRNDMQLCTFDNVINRGQCLNITGASYFSCGSAAASKTSCNALKSDQTLGTIASYLQCNWNDYAECQTIQECTSTGRCNDDEFYQWSSNGGSPIPGSCIEPWKFDQSGQRVWCNGLEEQGNYIRQTRIGCVKSQYVNATTCAAEGFVWHAKAYTQQDCDAHAHGCVFNDNLWNYKNMNGPTCSQCGGTSESLFQWYNGIPLQSEILSLDWVPRQYAPVNQWRETVDYDKWNQAIQVSIARKVARQTKNLMSQKYNRLIPLMQIALCDCFAGDTSASANCFAEISATVLEVECRNDPNQINTCGPFTWNLTNEANQSSSSVSVYRTMAGPFLLQFAENVNRTHNQARRLLTLASTEPVGNVYAIIKNTNRTIVGQIVGDGFMKSDSTETQICMTRSLMIDIVTADFSVPDFARRIDDSTISGPLVISDITVTGLQYCGTVSTQGLYFPVLRVSNYQNYTWATTDVPSNSDLSTSALSGIIGGVIGGVVILVLLFLAIRKCKSRERNNLESGAARRRVHKSQRV